MNTRHRSSKPPAAKLTAITPDQAWELSRALDRLGICLWNIFDDDFISRCHPETAVPLEPRTDVRRSAEDELPF